MKQLELSHHLPSPALREPGGTVPRPQVCGGPGRASKCLAAPTARHSLIERTGASSHPAMTQENRAMGDGADAIVMMVIHLSDDY